MKKKLLIWGMLLLITINNLFGTIVYAEHQDINEQLSQTVSYDQLREARLKGNWWGTNNGYIYYLEEMKLLYVDPFSFVINNSSEEYKHWYEFCDETEKIYIGNGACIGEEAFMGFRKVKKLTIPDGTITIGARAFANMEQLEEIEIPSSVQYIGKDAFLNCSKLKIKMNGKIITDVDSLYTKGGCDISNQIAIANTFINNSYGYNNWSSISNEYLALNDDNTYSYLVSDEYKKEIVIKNYDNKCLKILETKIIPMELDIFGAALLGKKYNFIAFGQNNFEEDANKEVIRIVKYDKNWKRIDSTPVFGEVSNIYSGATILEPFRFSNAVFSEKDDLLVLSFGRTMFKSNDGLNHQASLQLYINQSDMSIYDRMSSVYVSHSFGNYTIFDNASIITLNHGDAYPRALSLSKVDLYPDYIYIDAKGEQQTVRLSNGKYCYYSIENSEMATNYIDFDDVIVQNNYCFRDYDMNLYNIPGTHGDNYTGVSIGGLSSSEDTFLVVASSVDFSNDTRERNILLFVCPKEFEKEYDENLYVKDTYVKKIIMGDYINSNKVCGNPIIIKQEQNRFAICWQEFEKDNYEYTYVVKYVDGAGNLIGEESLKSDCMQIMKNLLANLPISSNQEIDFVASEWAKEELKKAAALDIIPEYLKKSDLTEPITRQEFAAVSVLAYESMSDKYITSTSNTPFVDCSDEFVIKAYNVGITSGVSASEFAPNELLNREQAATMLTRVFKKYNFSDWSLVTDSQFTLDYVKDKVFADDIYIDDWAKDSVYFMAANNIISGVGNNYFAPKNITKEQQVTNYANATREQAIIMATRMVENLKLK